MSIGGGSCSSNSQCGPCSICQNGTCTYTCNPSTEICLNGTCVPMSSNTSTYLSISGPSTVCISTEATYTINAVMSSLPYNGNILINIVDTTLNQYVLSTLEPIQNGTGDFTFMFNQNGNYAILANFENSNVGNGFGPITVGCCGNCGGFSAPTTTAPQQNPYLIPVLVGLGIGSGGLLLYYFAKGK